MIKKIFVCCFMFLSTTAFASNLYCGQALPTDNPNFCPSFKNEAVCNCTSRGLPKPLCQNMEMLYKRMLSMFGSLERACAYQQDTDQQTCIDDWNCFRLGGKDSKGRLCSSTGNRCPA